MTDVGGVNVIILVFIVSFAIDRVVNGALFVLSLIGPWRRRFPDVRTVTEPAERAVAEQRHKLLYVVLAAILAIGVLAYFGKIRILQGLNVSVDPVLDIVVTGLILIGGSDFVGRLLDMSGAYGGEKSMAGRPIEVTGTLTLQDNSDRPARRPE